MHVYEADIISVIAWDVRALNKNVLSELNK